MKLLCTFRPQAWQGDYAIDVDAEGPTQWVVDVPTPPKPYSHDSDHLRLEPGAPEWARDWSGPFEVEYEVQP